MWKLFCVWFSVRYERCYFSEVISHLGRPFTIWQGPFFPAARQEIPAGMTNIPGRNFFLPEFRSPDRQELFSGQNIEKKKRILTQNIARLPGKTPCQIRVRNSLTYGNVGSMVNRPLAYKTIINQITHGNLPRLDFFNGNLNTEHEWQSF